MAYPSSMPSMQAPPQNDSPFSNMNLNLKAQPFKPNSSTATPDYQSLMLNQNMHSMNQPASGTQMISPRNENKRSGSQGPQSASKVLPAGN